MQLLAVRGGVNEYVGRLTVKSTTTDCKGDWPLFFHIEFNYFRPITRDWPPSTRRKLYNFWQITHLCIYKYIKTFAQYNILGLILIVIMILYYLLLISQTVKFLRRIDRLRPPPGWLPPQAVCHQQGIDAQQAEQDQARDEITGKG